MYNEGTHTNVRRTQTLLFDLMTPLRYHAYVIKGCESNPAHHKICEKDKADREIAKSQSINAVPQVCRGHRIKFLTVVPAPVIVPALYCCNTDSTFLFTEASSKGVPDTPCLLSFFPPRTSDGWGFVLYFLSQFRYNFGQILLVIE